MLTPNLRDLTGRERNPTQSLFVAKQYFCRGRVGWGVAVGHEAFIT